MKLIFFSIIAFSMIGLIFPSGFSSTYVHETGYPFSIQYPSGWYIFEFDDEIEKIATEKFNGNTSQAIRYLVNLGVKFELIPKNELDKEKIEEITNEMNQKIKDETIFSWIDSLEPEQQKAIKNLIILKEE